MLQSSRHPLKVFPKAQQANLPACSAHCTFNTKQWTSSRKQVSRLLITTPSPLLVFVNIVLKLLRLQWCYRIGTQKPDATVVVWESVYCPY